MLKFILRCDVEGGKKNNYTERLAMKKFLLHIFSPHSYHKHTQQEIKLRFHFSHHHDYHHHQFCLFIHSLVCHIDSYKYTDIMKIP